MSLNWREIDRVLEELELENSFVREIMQPDYSRLILTCYRPGRTVRLLICLESGLVRLHETQQPHPKPKQMQRFVQFLRARIRNGRLTQIAQVDHERVVRIAIRHAGSETLFWIRLWSGAANIVVTDEKGIIMDAFYRRPRRGEVSGGRFVPPATSPKQGEQSTRDDARWVVRDYSSADSLNEWLDRHYYTIEQGTRRDTLLRRAGRLLERRMSQLRSSLFACEQRLQNQRDPERLRTLGQLILANIHRLRAGDHWLTIEQNDTTLSIELDVTLSPQENAQRYFGNYKRAQRATSEQQLQFERLSQQLSRLTAEKDNLEHCSHEELEQLIATLEHSAARRDVRSSTLRYSSNGFDILVGRTAIENDGLLRHHVRGNDLWLHVRDYPGAHVFVRARAGKSVPLETLLDAGTLALFHSRARRGGSADLYYTPVKYLRRVRGGAPGRVIPTREKNLTITIDEKRLARLREQQ